MTDRKMMNKKKRDKEIAGRLQVGRMYKVGTYLGPDNHEENEYHNFVEFGHDDSIGKNLMSEELAYHLGNIPEPDDSVMTEADRKVQGMIQKSLFVSTYCDGLGVFRGFDMLESVLSGGKTYYYFFSEGSCYDAGYLLEHLPDLE